MSSLPAISLPRFEGPLDLLLALVRQHQVAITDIPIAAVTRQYLDYLHRAQELDLDLGSEFAYMAATLIHIKARCLLPADPATASEPDPRQDLIRELLDHEQLRRAAEFLQQKLELSQAAWSRPPADGRQLAEPADQETPGAMNLLQVLQLAQQALETARAHQLLNLSREAVTVGEMITWLADRLAELPAAGFLPADALLAEQHSAERKVVLFLAMLEMAKTGDLDIRQGGLFEPIQLFRHNGTTVPER